MNKQTWEECPTTTNAVEHSNQDCSVNKPLYLKLAMMEAYKLDKVACYKYIAANEGISISYRSKTYEARRCSAAARKLHSKRKAFQDKTNELGPPYKRCHLQQEQSTDKTTVRVDESVVTIHSNLHLEVIGKRVRVKYDEEDGWYQGLIT